MRSRSLLAALPVLLLLLAAAPTERNTADPPGTAYLEAESFDIAAPALPSPVNLSNDATSPVSILSQPCEAPSASLTSTADVRRHERWCGEQGSTPHLSVGKYRDSLRNRST